MGGGERGTPLAQEKNALSSFWRVPLVSGSKESFDSLIA